MTSQGVFPREDLFQHRVRPPFSVQSELWLNRDRVSSFVARSGRVDLTFSNSNGRQKTLRVEGIQNRDKKTVECSPTVPRSETVDRFTTPILLFESSEPQGSHQKRPTVVTSKPANGEWPRTRLFYSAASCGGKSVFVRQLRG